MAQKDEFEVGTLVWCTDDDTWYSALVEAVNPESLVLEWAKANRVRAGQTRRMASSGTKATSWASQWP